MEQNSQWLKTTGKKFYHRTHHTEKKAEEKSESVPKPIKLKSVAVRAAERKEPEKIHVSVP